MYSIYSFYDLTLTQNDNFLTPFKGIISIKNIEFTNLLSLTVYIFVHGKYIKKIYIKQIR